MSRITEQKMADVLPAVVPRIVERGGQLAVCGKGDRALETSLLSLAEAFPGRVAVRIGYEEDWAKRCLAGSDVLLAPARFEPCGLIQMYGMRYGTLPVVRRVGGLADTVNSVNGLASGKPRAESSTGFMFEQPTAIDFIRAIDSVVDTYRRRVPWTGMQARAMRQDFSWRRSADRYIALYRDLVSGRPGAARDNGQDAGRLVQMAS